MSLVVSKKLLRQARSKKRVGQDAFYRCVETSLPFATQTVHALVHQAERSKDDMAEFVPTSLSKQERSQLLRAFASTAIRDALTVHFGKHQKRGKGVLIAFQNCHNVGVFLNTPRGRAAYKKWVSPEAQVLAQSPARIDC